MKHRCLLPFYHIAIRPDNRVFPCCQFRHDHTPRDLNLSHADVFHHPFMQDLRNKMINDEYVEGCSMCYEQEKISENTSSMRLNHNKGLGDTIPEKPTLRLLDLAISNVCNNRCRMCMPQLSTNWYSDAAKLGSDFFPKSEHRKIKYSDDILAKYDLSELRYIKLIGGEPLLEQNKFIKFLKRCNLSKLRILLTTNATVKPNAELLGMLKQCETCFINLSIDAFGSLNDFLRKGSTWDSVAENIKYFSNEFPKHVKIHSVISIYNCNNFYLLEDYLTDNYGDHVKIEYQIVDGPNWMQPANLPIEVKKEIIDLCSSFPIYGN